MIVMPAVVAVRQPIGIVGSIGCTRAAIMVLVVLIITPAMSDRKRSWGHVALVGGYPVGRNHVLGVGKRQLPVADQVIELIFQLVFDMRVPFTPERLQPKVSWVPGCASDFKRDEVIKFKVMYVRARKPCSS